MSYIDWRQFLLEDGTSISGAIVGENFVIRLGDDSRIYIFNPEEGTFCNIADERGKRKDESKSPSSPKSATCRKISSFPFTYNYDTETKVLTVGFAKSLEIILNAKSREILLRNRIEDETLPSFRHAGLRGGTKIAVGVSRGYGLFATEDIAQSEVVEEAPCLEQEQKFLQDYTFFIDERHILPLGRIVLINHSDDPNCNHFYSGEDKRMSIVARRPIKKGKEISINYGKNWFPSRGFQADKLDDN